MGVLSEDDIWQVASEWFSRHRYSDPQIASFDDFINHKLQSIIDQTGDVVTTNHHFPGASPISYRISFGKISISRPFVIEKNGEFRILYPSEARIRKMTYAADLRVNTKKACLDTNGNVLNEETMQLHIGEIPIMVKSAHCNLSNIDPTKLSWVGACPYDEGGYFIVNGSEKVMVEQEQRAPNRPYVFHKGGDAVGGLAVETKCIPCVPIKPATTIKIRRVNKKDKQYIVLTAPYLKGDRVPIGLIFRALGITTDEQIMSYICMDRHRSMSEYVIASVSNLTITQEEALCEISTMFGSSGPERGIDVIDKEFMPHIGMDSSHRHKKALTLGYMIHRLLLVTLKLEPVDSKDHYASKRLELSGSLIAQLFRLLYKRMLRDIRDEIQNSVNRGKDFNLIQAVKQDSITRGLKYCLATGNWNIGKNAMSRNIKTGVSQNLDRLNMAATVSHLRRISTSIGKEVKTSEPRYLHSTQCGMICPCETPEGKECGLKKNMASTCHVTIGFDETIIMDLLHKMGLKPLHYCTLGDLVGSTTELLPTKIYVNGVWKGMLSNARKTAKKLRLLRRSAELSFELSVSVLMEPTRRSSEMFISTDGGRYMRPLLIVKDGRLAYNMSHVTRLRKDDGSLTWSGLIEEGVVEYLDVVESEDVLIAMRQSQLTLQHTHCEIHPSLLLGLTAGSIPFPDHNQSPRNTYQSAMWKQAVGVPGLNYNFRPDTSSFVLWYGQSPVVDTRMSREVKYNYLPTGQNCIVMISTHEYAQDDAIVLNQSSLDRGLFRAELLITKTDEELKTGSIRTEKFEIPNKNETMWMRRSDYSKLDEDGLPKPGEKLEKGSCAIGKTILVGANDGKNKKRDLSTYVKESDHGRVKYVAVSSNHVTGLRQATVGMIQMRIPELGDKFSSRHGQKGIVGMVVRQEDMPFTKDGIVPDVIVGVHSCARMTWGQILECVSGKIGLLTGKFRDSTPFAEEEDITSKMAKDLHSLGYQGMGDEPMTCGKTGVPLKGSMFIGPTYYCRLKHCVEDKIHARCTGKRDVMCKQPVEGRARGGGLKIGEMEKDAFIAHGVSLVVKERLMGVSDASLLGVCEICGLMGQPGGARNGARCSNCKHTGESMQTIEIPYASKLLFQELMAMNMSVRFGLK
jgi:DNA-directed RNA polymerase II subunit RPB2